MTASLENAKNYINQLNFSMLIDKMVQHQGWSEEDAIKLSQLYRNFLFLKKKYCHVDEIPPSEEIDEFWHNHILDTENYHKDCQAIFGHYLHHYPYFGIDNKSNPGDLQQAFDRMQELHYKEFGYPVEIVQGLRSRLLSFLKRKWAHLKFTYQLKNTVPVS